MDEDKKLLTVRQKGAFLQLEQSLTHNEPGHQEQKWRRAKTARKKDLGIGAGILAEAQPTIATIKSLSEQAIK